MKEVLLNFLSTAFATFGETKFIEVMQQLHDKNAIEYEAAIRGLHVGVLALQPLVDKSKTPIDDAVLKALGDAIVASAEANNVTL